MNPSPHDSTRAPSESDMNSSSRLEAEAVLNVEDYRYSKRRRSSNDSCESDTPPKRHPLIMSATKELSSISSSCKTDTMTSNSAPNTPMTLIGLVQARRSSITHKTADLQAATTSLSLESVYGRGRFSRRSSHVSDMMLASRASQVLTCALANQLLDSNEVQHGAGAATTAAGATSEEAAALGYGDTDEPPAAKRRRQQRRNSFVIPETSRSTGQTTGFSWRAMDFLYGRPPGTAMATAAVSSSRRESYPPMATMAD